MDTLGIDERGKLLRERSRLRMIVKEREKRIAGLKRRIAEQDALILRLDQLLLEKWAGEKT